MEPQTIQRFGSLSIDREAREVTIDGQPVTLTRVEYELLRSLAECPRRAFSREELTRVLTHSDWADDTHALDTQISRLRRKLGESGNQPRRIVTVRGYGYRFEPDKAPDLAAAMAANAQPATSNAERPSLYTLVGLDRSILWASDTYTQVLGWHPSDLQGTSIYELLHPEDQLAAMAVKEELDSGFPVAAFGRLRSAAGDYRLFEVLVRPIIDPHNQVTAGLGEYREATTAQKIELAAPTPICMKRPDASALG